MEALERSVSIRTGFEDTENHYQYLSVYRSWTGRFAENAIEFHLGVALEMSPYCRAKAVRRSNSCRFYSEEGRSILVRCLKPNASVFGDMYHIRTNVRGMTMN